MSIQHTLGQEAWVRSNEAALKQMLPETWTDVRNVELLKIGFDLKLLGVDWRETDDIPKIMVFFERVGIMQRNGLLVRRNPNPAFFKGANK